MLHHLVVAVLLVAAGCTSTAGQSENEGSSAPVSVDNSAKPTPTSPATFAGTGPVHAAVRYVASTDTLMAHSSIGRAEIFRSLLTPSALAGQAAAFEEAATQMAQTLGVPVERLTWVEAPITSTLSESSASKATVDVWTVSILGSPDSGSPQQVWRTVHVDLEEIDGRWLVASASADAGPTPAANELSLQSGWDDFEVVAGWTPVIVGAEL